MRELLHRETFTQSSFNSDQLLHTQTLLDGNLYTDQLLHTEALNRAAFTLRCFYVTTFLHTDALTQRNLYTQTLLHRAAFAQSSFCTDFYTEQLLHRAFFHRAAFTQTLLHTDAFTHWSFYAETITQRSLYTQTTLLHTGAFRHWCFCTQTPLRTETLTQRNPLHSSFYRNFTHRPFCAGLALDPPSIARLVGWQGSGFRHGQTGFRVGSNLAAVLSENATHSGRSRAHRPIHGPTGPCIQTMVWSWAIGEAIPSMCVSCKWWGKQERTGRWRCGHARVDGAEMEEFLAECDRWMWSGNRIKIFTDTVSPHGLISPMEKEVNFRDGSAFLQIIIITINLY
jgi:hypothetical protein